MYIFISIVCFILGCFFTYKFSLEVMNAYDNYILRAVGWAALSLCMIAIAAQAIYLMGFFQ
jgi:hypothetical protein